MRTNALIPAPYEVREHDGFFIVRTGATVRAEAGLAAIAAIFASDVRADGGPRLEVGEDGPISLELVHELEGAHELPRPLGISPFPEGLRDEGYSLGVTPDGIRVRATSPLGIFRSLTTLRQLILHADPIEGGEGRRIPAVEIRDAPRVGWRSFGLDVARSPYSVAEVCTVIDMLALSKFNALQLHLTENEAWRIEIEGFPELTENESHSYTAEELRAIADYGRERFVTVVPEVDLPGHSAAFVRARPDLGVIHEVNGRDLAYVDPANEQLWPVVQAVFGQLLAITGSPYLHIGCDEAFGMPDELYEQFVRRAVALVRSLGAGAITFQEATRAGLQPGDVAQVWVDFAGPGGDLERMEAAVAAGASLPPGIPDGALAFYRVAAGDLPRAQERGVSVIASPTKFAYFDTPYAEESLDADQEARRSRLGLPVYTPRTLQDFYDWDPLTALPGLREIDLAGVACLTWADTFRDGLATAFLLATARIPGFAERAWSRPEACDWGEYRERLGRQAPLWRAREWDFFRSSLVDWR